MKFILRALKKYNKKEAKRVNYFNKFNPAKDIIAINASKFRQLSSSDIYFARSNRDFKKAQASDAPFIYYKKRGHLFYNENGTEKKLGKGGIIALLPRNVALSNNKYVLVVKKL